MRFRPLLTAVLVGGSLLSTRVVPMTSAHTAASPSCLPTTAQESGSAGRLVGAGNGFGFRLLRQIASHNTGKNVFISPTSVSLALDMAYDGSRGTTQGAMAKVLGVGGLSGAAVRAQAATLLTRLASDDPRVQLQIANALWARAGFPFNPQFVQHIAHSFGAKVATANFDSPSTVTAINAWVSCATHGTIASIINNLEPEDVMVLLNALYFHGDWSAPFHNADTHPGTFTTSAGTAKQIPFMSAKHTYAYAAGGNYQAISLPYGNGRYAMKIVLPKPGTSVSSLLRRATASTWQAWTLNMRPTEVALRLPRFTIRNSHLLNADLASLGMGQAFGQHANFTGICPRCFLSAVLHKTYLKVNEKGTTASAVTGVVVGTTAVGANSVTMSVDHPFLLSLQDSRTDAVLFVGAISDPTS